MTTGSPPKDSHSSIENFGRKAIERGCKTVDEFFPKQETVVDSD